MTLAEGWAACLAARKAGDRLGLLLACARLECGLSDAWSKGWSKPGSAAPGEEDDDTRRRIALAWTQAAAEVYVNGRTSQQLPTGEFPLETDLRALSYSDPEGLRHYALSLHGYVAAARRWQASTSTETRAWILGLRTMGSALAPVVWAALQPGRHRCTTLRPQGDPQQRVIRVSPRLGRRLRAWPGRYLIVDEGPGLSGSSFAGTVALLQSLGVTAQRIALLPSWEVDAAAAARLTSADAARQWTSWRCFAAAPLALPARRFGLPLQGAAWRPWLRSGRAAPVWGTHERLKYLTDGGRTLTKFAGLGPYGVTTWERARRLAAAGWGPEVVSGADEAAQGWVVYRRVRAHRLPERPGRAWAEWAGHYLAWVRSEFALGGAAPPTPELAGMLSVNLDRLGWDMAPPPMEEAIPVALDARLQRWEWGTCGRGWIKFDGTDHGDDPFFPGPADIAWDVAGLMVEFGPELGAAALATYRRRSGDTAAALTRRLAWHRLAYGAFRTAFCVFAADHVAPAEARRFRRQARRYRAVVESVAG